MAVLRKKQQRTRPRRLLPASRALAFFACLASSAIAQAPREAEVKAAFVYNFAHFTEWPQTAFEQTNSPLVIGILGSDPFGQVLDSTVHGEAVGGHPLAVQRYRTLAEVKKCHILYIGQSEVTRLENILATLKGKPILTVSDIENSAHKGVMIRFYPESHKIRLRINLGAAREANLSLSSKLLRAATEVVGPENKPPE